MYSWYYFRSCFFFHLISLLIYIFCSVLLFFHRASHAILIFPFLSHAKFYFITFLRSFFSHLFIIYLFSSLCIFIHFARITPHFPSPGRFLSLFFIFHLPSLTQRHSLLFFSSISLGARRLLRYSSPRYPWFPSHTLLIHTLLPHASSFPFSRFSHHLFRPVFWVPPCSLFFSFSLPLSLFPSHFMTRSRMLPEAIYFILLFGIASIHLSFPPSSSRTADRDRPSRRRRRGWTRTDWWRLWSVAWGCKRSEGWRTAPVVGASIVTVLNERPW